jgi:predicted amidohydrolase YtcJ
MATILPIRASGSTPEHNDILVIGGRIKTPSGWAQAMAIRDGKILAVGSISAVRRQVGNQAKTIDIKGMTAMPGLIDSHVHPLFAGLGDASCKLPQGANAAGVVTVVKACVASAAPGDWIQGGSWVAASFSPGQQTRALLDTIAPNNPVLLNDEALHSIWVNSLALKLAGIDRTTPDPVGGIIERDADGEPTGLLRETATRMVEAIVPPDSLAARRKAIEWASNTMLSYGITAFTVASIRDPDIEPFAQLTTEGRIKQRIRGCIVWDALPGKQNAMGERLLAERSNYTTSRFKPDCVKLFLDGVPTESHTGAMLHPYADRSQTDTRPEKGLVMIAQGDLNLAVARFDKMGLSVKFHATGDAAVRSAIDAIDYTRRTNGLDGPMHAVGHSTFVDPSDIPRVLKLKAAWEFSPYIWYPTPMASVDILKAVGAERMQRWMPIADALKTEAWVVAGSDWPVIPSVNPWLGIETLVTRARPGGSKEQLGPAQAISRVQAFQIFTANGAKLMGLGKVTGSLSPGLSADFIVTDKDPYSVSITSLHDIRVMMTFIDGERVFDRQNQAR